jgi:crotonobetaine/carnitine-CoA ligase
MIPDDIARWTIHDSLRHRARTDPGRLFVEVVGQRSLTYGETHERAAGMAGVLRSLGAAPGDAVVIMARNGIAAIDAWLGTVLCGAIEVSINTGYKGRPLIHALNTVKARLVLAESEFLERIAAVEDEVPDLQTVVCLDAASGPLADFSRISLLLLDDLRDRAQPFDRSEARFSDIASIVYTSGTSGPAKGVLMPNAQIYALARQAVDGLRLGQPDVYYCFHPMFHTAGKFIGLFAGLLSGARVVFDRSFDAASWLDRIREYGATATLAHGAMLEMVFAQPSRPEDSDNRLERLLASPFPRRIAERFQARFGVRGIEAWGMTEINNPCWCPLDEPLKLGSCGKADPAWAEVKVVDPETDEEVETGMVGEFVLRPRRPWTMMQGYIGMPEATVHAWRNLWFHTGDSGYVDEDGYYYFVDRASDRIRRRAENISSYDIESAAIELGGIAECAAVGVASDYEMDDDVKLYVVVSEGSEPNAAAIITGLARMLPHFMVPRYIEFIDALPRTPTNKVRKAELRERGTGGDTWDRRAAGLSLRTLT